MSDRTRSVHYTSPLLFVHHFVLYVYNLSIVKYWSILIYFFYTIGLLFRDTLHSFSSLVTLNLYVKEGITFVTKSLTHTHLYPILL